MSRTKHNFDFKGVDEIIKELKRFDEKTQKKVIKKATRESLKKIQKEIRNKVPEVTSNYKKSVKIRTPANKRYKGFSFVLTTNAPHSHLIEYGTDEREPKKGEYLTFLNKDGDWVRVRKVAPMRENPIWQNVYEARKNDVINNFYNELENLIQTF